MTKQILILDDDIEITTLLDEFLSSRGYHVTTFNNPVLALKAAQNKKNSFDLMILDIMMPDIDGFQVLRNIREFSSLPIIMLSAKGAVSDRVVGLELGADDFIPKPFEPQELLARIQSVLRRATSSDTSMVDVLYFKGLTINKISQEVLLDDRPVQLSTAELEALLLFVNNPNQPLHRDFLVENLRGIQWQTCDRSIDVLVSRLRQKLGETPARSRFIKTVHGIGYHFIGIKK